MAYTDEYLLEQRLTNNIPADYVTVRTVIGGAVFISPAYPQTIQEYQSGVRTGGFAVPAGVVEVPPPPVVEPTTVTTTPTNTVTRQVTATKKIATVPIFVQIVAKPLPIKQNARIDVQIRPAATPEQLKTVKYKFDLNRIPIQVNISEPMIGIANQFLDSIFEVYVDEDRELKTLLNYGEDKQSVVLAYRRGPVDIDGIDTIQLKLLQPVPDDIATGTPVFLSREVAKTTIDKIRVRFAPELDPTPYLRPKNLKVKADLDTGRSVRNVTLNKLSLQSGSIGRNDQFNNKTFEDSLFRQWYSYDFNSSELNIDFTNYENFIFYSSAAMRLAAFKQKMGQLEKLETLRNQILTSYTANTASAGFIYVQEKSQEYALEKENIIRAFDRYEQYLFFTTSGSNSPYSASFDYVDGGVEYNSIGYWPKSGNTPVSVTSSIAIDWYMSQSAIAQRFDEFNENNLVNTIPTHIRDDHDSNAYLTFVSMIGQLFDNIKLYIDQYPNIYSRNLDPNEELSKDLINEIAESIGFVLPTVDSVYNLTDNILGTTSETPRRDIAAQIYKRLLHNLPFFAKAKGTKTAVQAFLNTFGITPQLLSIKETGVPVTSSYSIFDEYSTGLDFDSTRNSHIRLPIATSNRNPTTLQFNCTVAKNQNMTILTGDSRWGLNVKTHPTITSLGRFEITSGSLDTVIVTSSYYALFDNQLLNVAIQTTNNTSSFYFTQVDGEDIIFNQIVSEASKFPNLWTQTNYVFMGGAGARVIGRYDGTLDEVRLWNTALSDEVLVNTAFDPGSNAGDTYTDAANHLLVQLSFNTANTSASLAANSMRNESPYKDIAVVPSLEDVFCTDIVESDFIRYNRTVKQLAMPVGSSTQITNKITVAPPPTFISDAQGLRLYRNKSIVAPQQKTINRGRNKVILAISPTEIINQNIIRNLGLENINAVLGAPTTLYNTFDKSLATIKNHYQQYYYVEVNTNKFIRILSDLASVLDQVVDYFIPSKATLLKGIIIEPNILEQVKVSPLKNIKVYGKNTRKTIDAANSLTGSSADYGTTFNLSYTIDQPRSDTTAKYAAITSQSNEVELVPGIRAVYNNYSSGSLQIVNQIQPTSAYQTYDLNPLTWQEYRYISNSYVSGTIENVSGSNRIWPKQKLDVGFSSDRIVSGTYSTVPSTINVLGTQQFDSTNQTYDLKHLTWQEYRHISNSFVSGTSEYISRSNRIWPKQRIEVLTMNDTFVSGNYLNNTGTIKVVDVDNLPIQTQYATYDLANLSWGDYRYISNSFVSGTVENISGSRRIWSKQKIDVGLTQMNKIKYNDVNNGNEGAEPYNRLYTRKLFNEEIQTTRFGGNTSIYLPALNEIPPSADFRDFGVYTYFNNDEGIYYFDEVKKIPTYPTPLNATWIFGSQSFGNTITTWSYGNRYNKNDVVYQYVTEETYRSVNLESSVNSENLIRFSKGGNGRYYVFKNRPAYSASNDGSFYSGSTPSYTPPSLDNVNWELLRFKPIQVRSPRRVVFDTYVISEPYLNNFKTTTISLETIINIPDRYIDTVPIGTIPESSYVQGTVTVQNIALLLAVQSSAGGLRLRLYRTEVARDADINRPMEVLPTGSHGVLLDTSLVGVDVVEISNPFPTLVAGETPPNAKLFYTIDNLDTTTKLGVNIQLYYFAIELEPRVPLGYLRKHYRFFRDNSTALKRRNFVGCKNTVDTTIDGLPPIQIFISEGSTIKVTDTTGVDELITGGGGTLDVT